MKIAFFINKGKEQPFGLAIMKFFESFLVCELKKQFKCQVLLQKGEKDMFGKCCHNKWIQIVRMLVCLYV